MLCKTHIPGFKIRPVHLKFGLFGKEPVPLILIERGQLYGCKRVSFPIFGKQILRVRKKRSKELITDIFTVLSICVNVQNLKRF